MKSRINPEWKNILKRAWSVRFMLLASVFIGAEAIVPLFVDALPRGVFAALTFVSIIFGTISRVIVQKDFDKE